MARFDRAIQTSLRLIRKNGQAVTWRVIKDSPAPADRPWNPGPTVTVDYSVTVCFLPVDRATLETFTFMQGTAIPKVSFMGLMGQVEFTPSLKDVIIRDGVQLRITSIDELAPNGQSILYTVLFE